MSQSDVFFVPTQSNYDFVSASHFHELAAMAKSGSRMSEVISQYDQSSIEMKMLTEHIATHGSAAWKQGVAPSGSVVYFASAGRATATILPISIKKTLNVAKQHHKELASAATACEFTVIYQTPHRSWSTRVVVGSSVALTEAVLAYAVAALIRAGCQAAIQRLTGQALAQITAQTLSEMGYTARALVFIEGSALATGLLAAVIAAALISAWALVMNRTYRHRLWVYNVTEHSMKLKVRHLHNVENNNHGAGEDNVLGPMQKPGVKRAIAGLNFFEKTTAISCCLFDFHDDRTWLAGIGSLISIDPAPEDKDLKNIIIGSYIPRFSENSLFIYTNEGSNKYQELYNKGEGINKRKMVKEVNGRFNIIHRIDKLDGAQNDTYNSFLFIVDRSLPQADRFS